MGRPLLPLTLLVLLCVASAAPAPNVSAAQPVIDTVITAGPAEGSASEDEKPVFSFSATRDGAEFPAASFHCSFDGDPAEPCTSPDQLDAIEEEGWHTFSVYAEDPETSARDPEPATRAFYTEFEAAQCEEPGEELEDEEGNVEFCEAEPTSPLPPAECLLRTARARVFTYTAQERIRLVVHYTSFSPADVLVDYGLSGGKGPLGLGEVREHFDRRGVLRLTERLNRVEMAKVRAAKRFTVDLDIPAAPNFCHRYDIRHLTVRRSLRGQVVWLQSGSVFGAGT
ncbi:MAG: hypothetical protein ACHQCF_02400 [Solirubrobacterales bacterium]